MEIPGYWYIVHGRLLSIPLYPSEVNIFFVRSWRWMNVSSLSLDDNSMDVVMEKGTLDSLQEKSRDTAGCLCYLASPCNKSDFDHVPYVSHMIPLELFCPDMLGASCI